MALSCAYPIIHTVSVDETGSNEYEITLDGETIYTGRVYTPENGAGSVDIDIAPICREHLYTTYEENDLNGASDKTVRTFAVDGTSYVVCYNYNTDYVAEIPEGTELNAPITDMVDPRQQIGTSQLTSGGISVSSSVAGGTPGNEITKGEYTYKVVAPCRNHYALYYVNKNGGIDYLLCAGKYVNKYATERTSGRLYYNMDQRLSMGDSHISQFVSKKYELNTGWLPDDRAANIDHLIFSPKVWIHNLETGDITSCLVDDNSVSQKQKRYDKTVNYTINVTESKKYIRK